MTTVVAAARDGAVYMATDSCTAMYERPITGVKKMVKPTPEVLLGVAGSFGVVDVLATELHGDYIPQPPDRDASADDAQSWAHRLAVAISRLAVNAGLAENGRMDANLILGWNGRLWSLCHACAVPHDDGVAAIGSGEGLATGALDALLAAGVDPLEAVYRAVQIACRRDRYSEPPIYTEVLPA